MNKQLELLRQVRLALNNNQFHDAIDALEQVVKLADENGDIGAKGRHLGNLALLYYRLDRPKKALSAFKEALICAQQVNDRFTESGLLGNIGNILREMRHYKDALQYLDAALQIAEAENNTRGRGIWLSNIGLVYDDLKQPQEAIRYHLEAVEVARELNDQRGLSSRLSNLGNSYVSIGDLQAAIPYFEEMVSILRAIGETNELALRLGILGNLYSEWGRSLENPHEAYRAFQHALDFYIETLKIARELNDVVTHAQVMRSIAHVLMFMGHAPQAVEYYQTAAELFQALGMQQEYEQTRHDLKLAEKTISD
ncbi:MAG: hypothetical protein CUN56_09790 [Phototrophicales bacterium]|nr:MAG: hypothetical protein CUN56_09790 [Phototrophicales bacterium]